MAHRIEIAFRPGRRDPRGEHVAAEVRTHLGIDLGRVRTRDVYHVDAALSNAEVERVVRELTDPVLQVGASGRVDDGPFDVAVTVGYKPGVTDPVGKSALVAVRDTVGRELGEEAAAFASKLYLFEGIDRDAAERIALELLANPVVQTARVQTWDEWRGAPPDTSVPRIVDAGHDAVRTIDLSGSDDALERISREGLLALDLREMRTIRDHFAARSGEGSDRARFGLTAAPTDVELECLAQTWSEHCKHKIFAATIRYREDGGTVEVVPGLFRTHIRGATESIEARRRERGLDRFLVSVFHDNAGVVAFDEAIHLVYKVETHNSPSALDPYGGAITGIVGVNRDPFGTGRGADLLMNVWGYCFASPFYSGTLPRGLLHPRRIRDGVHAGVIDGGNQSGIPYGRGFEMFDDRFAGKPLVFCGTVGALPVEIAGTPGEEKAARPGDRIVMVGGRIGADGIHGATFSSAALDESAPVQAVQIGDPITQKLMFDFLLEARDRGLYSAITDNGAGGLSSSVGEMAQSAGGAEIDLARAPLKYPGLAPWEIFLSEAQERMTLAVPPERLDELLALAASREVEATDLGVFTAEPVLHVLHGGRTVGRLEMAFLHDGAPDLDLEAEWRRPTFDEPPRRASGDLGPVLDAILARPGVAIDERRYRMYDHEVKGLSVVRPFVGVHRDIPSEATVSLARHGSLRGFVLSEGVNPFYSDIDTEAMAECAVDEAVRRQVCAGARLDRVALLDNFCWPDPVHSERTPDGRYKLAQLVRACRGLERACVAYDAPLVSGKDSMKNDSVMGGVKISVPPTLLVSAIGQIDDVRDACTLSFDRPGDLVYFVGPTGEDTGASEYFRYLGARDGAAHVAGEPAPYVGSRVPGVDFETTLPRYGALARAIASGSVRSAATPGRGGLALALVRSTLAGDLGVEIDLALDPSTVGLDADVALFSETTGRFVVTVHPDDAARFEATMRGHAAHRVGKVADDRRLIARVGETVVVDRGLDVLRRRFRETFIDD